MSKQIKARVNRVSARVREPQEQIRAKSAVIVSRNIGTLDDIDIDPNTLQDGSILVYDNDDNKWKPTIDLFKQNMDAGEF